MAHKICSPAVMKSKNKQLIKSINKKNVHLKGSEEGCAIPMVRYLQFLRMSLDHKHYQPCYSAGVRHQMKIPLSGLPLIFPKHTITS